MSEKTPRRRGASGPPINQQNEQANLPDSSSNAPARSGVLGGLRRNLIDPYRNIQAATRRFLWGTFLVGMGWAIFVLLFNLYLRDLGYPESFMGRVWSAMSVGMILMTLPAATLLARFSVRWLVVVSAILAGLGYLVLATAASAWMMMAAAVGVGLSSALPRVAAAPYFMRHTSKAERAHVFSLQFAAMLGAGLFAYFGGGWLHRELTSLLDSTTQAYRCILLVGVGLTMAGGLVYSRISGGAVVERTQSTISFWQRAREKGPLLFQLTLPFLSSQWVPGW